jgi:hypothetical protein
MFSIEQDIRAPVLEVQERQYQHSIGIGCARSSTSLLHTPFARDVPRPLRPPRLPLASCLHSALFALCVVVKPHLHPSQFPNHERTGPRLAFSPVLYSLESLFSRYTSPRDLSLPTTHTHNLSLCENSTKHSTSISFSLIPFP